MSLELALKGLISEVLAEAGVIKSPALPVEATGAAPAAAPARRGRGRPVVGETPPSAAPAPAPVAAPEADPFSPAPPAAAPAPNATLDDVRVALTTLRAATTQENALKVLKDASGVDNLTALSPDKYGAVVVAARQATPSAQATPAAEVDPFEATPPVNLPVEKPLTLEDVKAACVEGAKRTSQDTVLKVVFEHGGRAPLPQGGEGASLKALSADKYAAVIAAIKALPTTK